MAVDRNGPHTVYVARDADGAALYVGCTHNLHKRMTAHARLSDWHPHMASLETTEHPDWWTARLAEADAIRTLNPAANRLRMRRPSRFETDIMPSPGTQRPAWSDELMAAADIAALIGRSTRTVARMTKAGEIPFQQKLDGPSGAYLYDRAEVLAWFSEREASASSGSLVVPA